MRRSPPHESLAKESVLAPSPVTDPAKRPTP
jgi:hypothetical protein